MPEPLTDGLKVVLVAAPLMAKSGVYRSTIDLVNEARSVGLEWSAVIGMRAGAAGASLAGDHIEERVIERHGLGVFSELSSLFESHPAIAAADVVITLVSQSDIAFSATKVRKSKQWVAWTRGLPWPAPGEDNLPRRVVAFQLEKYALRRADEVWATTPVLAAEVARAREPRLVRAGIPTRPAVWHPGKLQAGQGDLTWAGRFKHDKNPIFAAEVGQRVDRKVVFYGQGPLEAELSKFSADKVEIRSWVAPDELWNGAAIYLGSSIREAFGRSVVEAAMAGVPIVLSNEYGAAPLLFTDPELASLCVLPVNDLAAWQSSVQRLLHDEDLAGRVSAHVHANAQLLTIGASVRAVVATLGAAERTAS